MAIIRAVATLKAKSGLPRDNVTNTFHFEGNDTQGARENIADSVFGFYVNQQANTGVVANFLTEAFSTIDVSTYTIPGTLTDGRETPAGPPTHTRLGAAGILDLVPRSGGGPLPNEVALCISYQGTPGPGVVQRRRRGRIYIGPLNVAAQTTVALVSRPSTNLKVTCEQAIVQLANAVDPVAEFVVYSRPYPGRAQVLREGRAPLPALPARPGTTVNVDEIWVDDEFDTQRRRGLRRTGRTIISTGEV